MFWGLAAGVVDSRGFEFEHVLRDIQTLNEWALEGRLEVSAISLHSYPFVQDRYLILPHGASMGSGYGPIVVASEPLTPADLRDIEIVVPGRMTTAFLVLRLYLGGEYRFREVPFDEIMGEVKSGPAHLRFVRPPRDRRPRGMVASGDRPAASARDQRRAPRSRRGHAPRAFGGLAGVDLRRARVP